MLTQMHFIAAISRCNRAARPYLLDWANTYRKDGVPAHLQGHHFAAWCTAAWCELWLEDLSNI